jgi:hypothetical protein
MPVGVRLWCLRAAAFRRQTAWGYPALAVREDRLAVIRSGPPLPNRSHSS